ncbi:hypothetical protein DOK67_0001312 [Enterococcus sp. DIV0212c]|uniref:helix-turn-helix domain-containing protein n=1 Tax=Enterococcus sp. DIV0212c TaxID=2230867 RepID=UPI001A9B3981|nr:Rgg/GadR/MutR family transcriptional regulator [Enterococcus sp. DIV0212c]MBO1355010.1 helix-turn-helix domain-containing protein [Enterococcus sp. DIV0212c]
MENGNIIRYIRKSRNLSLADLSDDTISVSFISKFERGNSDISSQKLYDLLNKLSVSYQEFLSMKDKSEDNCQRQFLKELKSAVSGASVIELDTLIKSEEKKYKTNYITRHAHNISICKLHIERIEQKEYSRKIVDSLWNYLINIDVWFDYDVSLFNNVFFCFSLEQVSLLVKGAQKRLETELHIFRNTNELLLLLLNLIIFFIENEGYKQAKKFIVKVESLLDKPEQIYEKNKLNFLKGILLIAEGERSAGIEKANQVLKVLKVLELQDIHDSHQKYLERFLKKTI